MERDWLIPDWPAAAGVRAVCTTRQGGCSLPPYRSLNLGDPAGTARALFEGDEPFLLNIGTAHLTREQASRLKRRLTELLAEFDLPVQEGAEPYSVGLLMARGEVS